MLHGPGMLTSNYLWMTPKRLWATGTLCGVGLNSGARCTKMCHFFLPTLYPSKIIIFLQSTFYPSTISSYPSKISSFTQVRYLPIYPLPKEDFFLATLYLSMISSFTQVRYLPIYPLPTICPLTYVARYRFCQLAILQCLGAVQGWVHAMWRWHATPPLPLWVAC